MLQSSSTKLVGEGPEFKSQMEFIKLSSRSSAPVLLMGETGCGKEATARFIHLSSGRRNHPFLVVDCSLYYERELERELFGVADGDSKEKINKGLLEFSSRGTCYIANAEELSPLTQERLFNYLETGYLQRVGSDKPISSRVRLIFSSTKDLRAFVDGGLFSPKLFGCFHGLLLDISPLRKHPEDIASFIEHFSGQFNSEKGKKPARVQFSSEALKAFYAYPWPGNFDELKNELLRVFRSGLDQVLPENLHPDIAHYWLGCSREPQVRRVIEELESYIREFRLMVRLDAEYGDVLLDHEKWEFELESFDRQP
ncbi:MAG: sigma 54-interacting transcriptional regulator [Planctomycetes bacterium]|nr:sigma 54-interacting transcriptional regulator [Planctomycetota bacterium]